MHDLIKSRQIHTKPEVGCLLRASSDGSRLNRLRSIGGPRPNSYEQHGFDFQSFHCTVESYGRLAYGRITHAKQLYIRTGTLIQGRTGNWWVMVDTKGWNKHWDYLPVEIYSIHPTEQQAYERGQRSAKFYHKSPMSWQRDNLPLIQIGLTSAHEFGRYAQPYKYEIALASAWAYGYESVPIPEASVWNEQQKKTAARNRRLMLNK